MIAMEKVLPSRTCSTYCIAHVNTIKNHFERSKSPDGSSNSRFDPNSVQIDYFIRVTATELRKMGDEAEKDRLVWKRRKKIAKAVFCCSLATVVSISLVRYFQR